MKSAAKSGPLTILFSGHDMKFLRHLQAYFRSVPGYRVLLDEHEGHVIRDTDRSRKLMEEADIIFCEWCLGNAEWYSRNKGRGQILVVRLHHQEISQNLPFLDRIEWKNVDSLVFICPYNMSVFLERFPGMKDRTVLIHNSIDCRALALPKLPGAQFNLGIMGTVPMRKAPHSALDIFETLKAGDNRYTLFIKGRHPWEYRWLWNRAEERRYYEDLYARVSRSEFVDSIVFDPQGDDVPEWFSKIGFIFSTSEHEGSHQAVAEGMAAGSIPVIRNWPGSELLYPGEYIYESVDEAVALIRKWNTPENYGLQSGFSGSYAREYFDKSLIIEQYKLMLNGLLLEGGWYNPGLLSGGEAFSEGWLV